MENNSFLESLSLILDESNQYSILMGKIDYVQEGTLKTYIKNIDIKAIFKYILDKFVSILKKIWNGFRTAYHNFTAKSSLLKRYRKKLETIDWDINFPEERQIYTKLDDSTTSTMYKLKLDREFSILTQGLEKLKVCRDTSAIHTTIINMKNNIVDDTTFLDEERGSSIGSYSSISKEEYPQKVIEYFRPDKKLAAGVIHPTETKELTKEYFESKTIEKKITNEEKDLEVAADKIKASINSLDISKYVPDKQINPDISVAFTEVLKSTCNHVQGLCNIYIQLFSIKLDMFKEYKEQQVRTLSKIILISMKEGKM